MKYDSFETGSEKGNISHKLRGECTKSLKTKKAQNLTKVT